MEKDALWRSDVCERSPSRTADVYSGPLEDESEMARLCFWYESSSDCGVKGGSCQGDSMIAECIETR